MKVGLIARCDDRGLGHMTWDFYRWVRPERTLVVRHPAAEAAGFAPHPERYPDGLVVQLQHPGALDEAVVRPWLDGLDVLYTAEVPYDWRLFDWCRAAGVRSVLHIMPEALPGELPSRPDALWAPTTWLLDLLPAGTEVVPVPVEPRTMDHGPCPEPLRVLHVAGHIANGDRNGTTVWARAVRLVRQPMVARMECQDRRAVPLSAGPHVDVQVHLGGRPDRWAMYADADVLVLPRRYGGLCLPAQEGMACGLGLVMSDTSPNRDWPIDPVPVSSGRWLRTGLGLVRTHDTNAAALAVTLDRLAADPEAVAGLRARAAAWAAAHAWPALLDTYRARLAGEEQPAASGF